MGVKVGCIVTVAESDVEPLETFVDSVSGALSVGVVDCVGVG